MRTSRRSPWEIFYAIHEQVVLNNFGDKDAPSHVKLMKVTLQNMFPSINVATIKLSDCRRVVMFNLDKATGRVEMRHYAVRATPTGITKAIKKVLLVRHCMCGSRRHRTYLGTLSRDMMQYLASLVWCVLTKPPLFMARRMTCFSSTAHSDGASLDCLDFHRCFR